MQPLAKTGVGASAIAAATRLNDIAIFMLLLLDRNSS
jgi:hypothetical protein